MAAAYSLNSGTSGLADWSSFVAAAVNEVASNGNGANVQGIFAAVAKTDNELTLRKAALLLRGSSADGAGGRQRERRQRGQDLAEAVRALMSGEGFESFLMESVNNRLLTQAFSAKRLRCRRSLLLPQLPISTFRCQAPLAPTSASPLRRLHRSHCVWLSHVVTNERPYTEVLTADYIMVNPYSAEVYGGNVTFDDPGDPDEWREGRITEYYRCTVCGQNNPNASYNIATDYPHAGLLNSPAFLSRFPSTDTNRNRARARWAYYFFLGVDIEGLSERTTDQSALADENNPTLNNSNCTVCHNIMDPVAGPFQNYGDEGFYKDQARRTCTPCPALIVSTPTATISSAIPGTPTCLRQALANELAPNSDNSIQWLGRKIC